MKALFQNGAGETLVKDRYSPCIYHAPVRLYPGEIPGNWMKDNIRGRWYGESRRTMSGYINYYFEVEQEAIVFSLKWA